MTLRDVIACLDEFGDDETIYAESTEPNARALVAPESVGDPDAGLRYLLEVSLAREAIDVWQTWRPGRTPTLDDKIAAVTYYALKDAWLPCE